MPFGHDLSFLGNCFWSSGCLGLRLAEVSKDKGRGNSVSGQSRLSMAFLRLSVAPVEADNSVLLRHQSGIYTRSLSLQHCYSLNF